MRNDCKIAGRASGFVELRQQLNPRLLCDAMLGSLCRWLRFFGLDCEFAGVEADDAEVGARAEAEGRWLLTADRELAGRGPRTMLVRSLDLEDQLVEVLSRLRLEVRSDLEHSRCSHCNGLLVEQGRDDVADDVPPYVLKTAERFKRCGSCSRIFWPGTHGESILARMQRVVARLG
ncbi:MAG: Mut7-C RNAse domain-containing protein [Acidobacteria bacterium]|nr:Mut7-C RNAse domain-containing protein [Acidobacteriota bacterium]